MDLVGLMRAAQKLVYQQGGGPVAFPQAWRQLKRYSFVVEKSNWVDHPISMLL